MVFLIEYHYYTTFGITIQCYIVYLLFLYLFFIYSKKYKYIIQYYMDTDIFYFIGRQDGIGNRIEQLINIQEYCKKNNVNCIYIWVNSSFRNYKKYISFENIEIRDSITNKERDLINEKCMIRSLNFPITYNFTFSISNNIEYDTIIHLRGTDRISSTITHSDYSTLEQFKKYIDKTIEYINKSDIRNYTIVSDCPKFEDLMKYKITKPYINLSYDYPVERDWLDFYYLTKPKNNIIMCCKFSSFSITASILGRKKLLVYKSSLKSNLPRYKADIEIIDE
jgi:hypothetical protein